MLTWALTLTNNSMDCGTWWIGHIQKMHRRASATLWGSLKHPMDLANCQVSTGKKGVAVANVEVILHYYARALG